MRRRGYPAQAIRNFLETIGITKYSGVTDIALLEHAVRDVLNPIAFRYMGVMDPLKVVIENYPEGETEELTAINNPADENSTTRSIPFAREIYVERSDFMEDAPRKFFRLSVGREVRLRYAYLVTCTDVIKDDNGNVIELRCTYDPESRGGNAPDGRRVKGTIHWVSANDAIDATINIYDRLFTVENPTGEKDKEFTEFINPDSLKTIKAKVEPAVKDADSTVAFQFERTGYFIHDSESSSDNLILNRTVPLRDSWGKKKKNPPNNQHKKKK
jgi:glutaminyl-tRNA synthetase